MKLENNRKYSNIFSELTLEQDIELMEELVRIVNVNYDTERGLCLYIAELVPLILSEIDTNYYYKSSQFTDDIRDYMIYKLELVPNEKGLVITNSHNYWFRDNDERLQILKERITEFKSRL